jgi:hypothetical protein
MVEESAKQETSMKQAASKGKMFVQNTGWIAVDYMALYPRRQKSRPYLVWSC